MNTSVDLLGWVGAIMLLAAYAGVSFKKMPATSQTYQLLNAAGSVALVVNTLYHQAWPAAFLNGLWALIAGVAWLRVATKAGQ